jgi:aminomethyltransferase
MLLEPDMSDAEKSLPLDNWHRSHGARMVPFAGHLMPVQYEGIIAEHRWTRESASLFDVSHMGQFLIFGRDLENGLESLMPADIKALKDGRLRYSLLLNEEGGVIDDLMVTRRDDHFYLVVNGATREGDLVHLQAKLRTAVVDDMKEQSLLALQGPKAVAALSRLAAGVERLTFMSGAMFTIAAIPVWISRSGYTGEDGFEISVPSGDVHRLADLLLTQAEVRPAGLGARDSLRLEAGLPLYGHDLDHKTTPLEADLGFAISKRRRDTGGFPGFERIQRELERGPVVRRVGLSVEGRQPVREGAMVVDGEGNEVGRVTSGGFSPTLEAPIAMAFVPVALSQPGTPITLAQRGKLFSSQVVAMPFVPHRYHRTGAAQ